MKFVRRWILVVTMAVAAGGLPGCAFLQKADTQFVKAAETIEDAVLALDLLDLALTEYLDGLGAPTVQELADGARQVEHLKAARDALREAGSALRDYEWVQAADAVVRAVREMEAVVAYLKSKGVPLSDIEMLLRDARRAAGG